MKPNEREFTDLAGRRLSSLNDSVRAAREFSERFQTMVVVSLGAEGALAANRHAVWHVRPPQLAIRSAVGSGDSAVAGITYGLVHGFALEEAIKYGVAAGTANALTVGAGVFTADDFRRALSGITITRLA